MFLLMGCTTIEKEKKGQTTVEYEVLEEADIPEEMKKSIKEKKAEPFRIVYRDMDFLYLAEGYGRMERSGYCIEITNCAETETAIYIETTLHGPGGEGRICETEFPYCVIRTTYSKKPVIFEE